MAYQKQTWNNYNDSLSVEQNKANKALVTAEGLNHIETGIEQVEFSLSQQLEQTEQELNAQLAQTMTNDYTFYKQGITGADNINMTVGDTASPIITFIDDDIREEVYTRLYPIFQAKGEVFTSALISNWIGNNQYMTEEQIDELASNGIEFVNHTSDHVPYNSTDDIHWERQIKECKEWLYKKGFAHDILVQPLGQGSSGTAQEIVQKYAKCAFNGTGLNSTVELSTFNIKRSGFGSWVTGYPTYEGAPLEHYKSVVDDCVANGSWLVFMSHVGVQTLEQDVILGQLIDYIQSLNVEIITASEGFRRKANRLEINSTVLIDREGKPTPTLNINNVELVNTPRLNSTPITSYPDGKLTVTPLNKTYMTGTFGASEFALAGELTTDRTANYETAFGKQYMKIYQTNEIWFRSWLVSGTWSVWDRVQLAKETTTILDKVVRTSATSPNEYEMGKITYTFMTGVQMSSGGFPTKAGSILKTDSFVGGSYAYIRQTLEVINKNEIYTRPATSNTTWGAWVKVGLGESFTSANRPTNATVGFTCFDTTLSKPIWLKTAPSTWVDATGTTV